MSWELHGEKARMGVWPCISSFRVFYGTALGVRHQGLNPSSISYPSRSIRAGFYSAGNAKFRKCVFSPQLLLPPDARSRPPLPHQAEGEPQAPRPPEPPAAAPWWFCPQNPCSLSQKTRRAREEKKGNTLCCVPSPGPSTVPYHTTTGRRNGARGARYFVRVGGAFFH